MTQPSSVLWLVWQNTETRQRYHVGNLIHYDNEYIFKYEHHGHRTFHDAVRDGYQPHVAFPDPHKIYRSKRLFSSFARRLPDKRRPDFQDILNDLGLSQDHSEMDLLKATGGRLATDAYEFVMPIHVHNSYFHFDFYVAGWRYYNGEKAKNELRANQQVKLKREPNNENDPFAVMVYSVSGIKLGYVPAFYSEFLHDVLEHNQKYQATIEKFNVKAKPQLKLKVSVVGHLFKSRPNKFHPVKPEEYVLSL